MTCMPLGAVAGDPMNDDILRVVAWVREHGRDEAVQQVRMRVLARTIEEGLRWDAVEERPCSPAYLDAVRVAASEVVGVPCPV
jgi:hypothetical protein